jgi:hypothetical protein
LFRKRKTLSVESQRMLQPCHVRECEYKRGLDWRLDLLATLTHDSWLHSLITATLVYPCNCGTYSLLCPLFTDSLAKARLVSSLYSPWHGPCRKHRFPQFICCCALTLEVGTGLFRGRYLVTGLHAAIYLSVTSSDNDVVHYVINRNSQDYALNARFVPKSPYQNKASLPLAACSSCDVTSEVIRTHFSKPIRDTKLCEMIGW